MERTTQGQWLQKTRCETSIVREARREKEGRRRAGRRANNAALKSREVTPVESCGLRPKGDVGGLQCWLEALDVRLAILSACTYLAWELCLVLGAWCLVGQGTEVLPVALPATAYLKYRDQCHWGTTGTCPASARDTQPKLTYTTPDLLSLNGIACLGNINIHNHEHHPTCIAKEYNVNNTFAQICVLNILFPVIEDALALSQSPSCFNNTPLMTTWDTSPGGPLGTFSTQYNVPEAKSVWFASTLR